MVDKAVGYQVVVFNGLSLLVAAVLGDDAFAAEEGPFEEAVEGFALVGVPTPNVKNRTLRNLYHSFEAAKGRRGLNAPLLPSIWTRAKTRASW